MGQSRDVFDRIVIGAGIAGASVASELAATGTVALLERESQPGYHTTGRSAAMFTVAYGPPVIRALTRASKAFFTAPESDFVTVPLLRTRGALFVARHDQAASLAALATSLGAAVTRLDADQARAMVPVLREGYAAAGLLDAGAADIDVDALHQHFLKTLRARGGDIRTRSPANGIVREGDLWRVATPAGEVSAPVLVNAAGAWADAVAAMAGVAPVGLIPKRRTALLIAPPEGINAADWPLVVDVDERFYLKPDAGKLLISPADETPSPPCDARPEEIDVAICVDRIERAFDLSVRRIEHQWAGLRSFLPDGDPVAGYDPGAEGFFWLAGQGGYGIQTSPALARLAAALINGDAVPADIAAEGVTADALARANRGRAG